MESKSIPGIRFSEFSRDWEEVKLGDVLKERKVKQKISEEAPLLAFAAGQGVIDRSERKTNNRDFLTNDSTEKSYLITKLDDIVYNPSNLKYGAIDRNKHGYGVISPIYVTFETNEIPSFIELIVKSNAFKQRALRYEEGTVTKRQSVKPENLLSLNVVLPNSKDEQIKIGNFFEELEAIITIHKQELDTLKQTKQGFLQKMFPKEGESVPEIRFPGFTGNWQTKTLGEVGNTQSGVGFPEDEQGGEKGIPFYKVSDMTLPGNENTMNVSNNYVSQEQVKRKRWKVIDKVPTIIFAKVGAALMLNRKRLVAEKFLMDNNTMAYIFSENWDVNFGKAIFETINLPKYAQVGALPSFNGKDIESIKVLLPPQEEQVKVGNFFKQLDDTIALREQELEILKQTKKAFLQKMFV